MSTHICPHPAATAHASQATELLQDYAQTKEIIQFQKIVSSVSNNRFFFFLCSSLMRNADKLHHVIQLTGNWLYGVSQAALLIIQDTL